MTSIYIKKDVILEPEFSGLLIPAEEPTPQAKFLQGIPQGTYKVLFGNAGVAWTKKLPFVVLETEQEPLLTINEHTRGISITAKIYSDDNKIVAEILNNEWHVNPNNYFRKERPNKSTLVVFDQKGNEVLNIYYLNHTTFRIVGVFRSLCKQPAIIKEDCVIFPGNNVLKDFAVNAEKAAIRF